MTNRPTVLILGGYGIFGGRLATLLAGQERLTLIIAGRSRAKAEAFIAGLPEGATFRPMAIDRDSDLEAVFRDVRPDVVVDATGPFQTYSGDRYRVVRAALAVGCNYLDLADGATFVRDVVQFDGEARAKGRFVLSGVSSFPVLTIAAIRALSDGLSSVDTVTGGIAPSPFAGVGANVIRAITAYAGQPVEVMRDGRLQAAHPLTETMRYTIAPPGELPLRNTRFSLVEVPDLLLVPQAIPGVRSVWMGAGPVPEILHRALNGFAWVVRLKLLPSISFMAPLCFHAINVLRWGEHRGGMFVAIIGKDHAGEPVRRSWHLLAEGTDGPLIPSMAIQAIILKLLAGEHPAPGARGATDALTLADYDIVFGGRRIITGIREDNPPDASRPLYQRVLESAWNRLPAVVRRMHETPGDSSGAGMASVETGRNPLAWAIRRLFGFPEAGSGIPVSVHFQKGGGKETWRRAFGRYKFSSVQMAGKGRDQSLLVERFGAATFAIALVLSNEKLNLIVRGWRLFGVPMPMVLCPQSTSFEFELGGRFHFHVEIRHPLTGLIVRYRGWLEAAAGGDRTPVSGQ